jgi:hypothetical protein
VASGEYRRCQERLQDIVMACALLLAAAATAGNTASANPRHAATRPPREAARPVTEPAQIGAWLRRLAGRYRFDGSVEVRMRATVPDPPPGEESEPPSLADQIIERTRMESGQSDVLEGTPVRGSPPPPMSPGSCSKTIRIEARPDARTLHFSVDIELDGQRKTTYALSMRRLQQNGAATPPAAAR